MAQIYDVFISHASEDKESFVRPLAEALRRLGVSVWYDEFSLQLGESLARGIDKGIAGSRFGVVVISQAFLRKSWTEHELRGLVNRDVDEDMKILPIWHGVSKRELMAFSPSLADKMAIDTRKVNAQEAAITILRQVRPDLYSSHPRAELEKLASGRAIEELQSEIEELRERLAEYQCPHCAAPLSTRTEAPIDDAQKHWDVVEIYECGYHAFAGTILRPCPSDPAFPKLEDYELFLKPAAKGGRNEWMCFARPKTEMARKLRLDEAYGKTKEEARRKVEAHYLYQAKRMTNDKWVRIQMGDEG